jgi:hypothetical protein
VETHDSDPTSNRDTDPWDGVSDDFGALREQLKETYRKVARNGGPTDDEIKQAFATLAAAWDQVAESMSTALKDPEVREQLKETASSFATALGTTITEFGEELRKTDLLGEEE